MLRIQIEVSDCFSSISMYTPEKPLEQQASKMAVSPTSPGEISGDSTSSSSLALPGLPEKAFAGNWGRLIFFHSILIKFMFSSPVRVPQLT